eukprot:CAMPEP_0175054044 /NCGR_PEP_ID=MMETSP0052_2-20121109/9276_1 /TAXON_ID=51329 ORGANISM="Polytomella parva, Strain SAG 63-3" /NCGR_SAMPLE_ID=MMETSP0052_2 /ASSEMBLY_ACC=CAM_ASM_000194 /LENGTH=137 /DNA_ID=CAMNT_0016318675 /DNA_START=161 /DNA_END=574 /DNA_ORIENTATION=+
MKVPSLILNKETLISPRDTFKKLSRRNFVSCPSLSDRTSPNSSGADAGQITLELMGSMKQKLCEALETTDVEIIDVNGDGRHVTINVTSHIFKGKSAVKRQRMVYKAIWQELLGTVHAVDELVTCTPEEAESGKTDA